MWMTRSDVRSGRLRVDDCCFGGREGVGNALSGKYVFLSASYRNAPSTLGGGVGDDCSFPSDKALFRARCCSSSNSISLITALLSGCLSDELLGQALRRLAFLLMIIFKEHAS